MVPWPRAAGTDPPRVDGGRRGGINILRPTVKTISYVDYHQLRHGDIVTCSRRALCGRVSDEDQAEARVGDTLEAQRGRSIIRDTHGSRSSTSRSTWPAATSPGLSRRNDRKTVDEHQELHGGTYWGPSSTS
jgi:hypothetical protein